MITGELKSQIDRIWTDFWSNGIADPLTVIQQISYLIFLKQLDDREILIEKEINQLGSSRKKNIYSESQNELRWSYFKDRDPETMFDLFVKPQKHIGDLTVFDFMKSMGSKGGKFSQYMKDAIFLIGSPKLLDKVVQQIDKLPLDKRDTKGDLYEYMLSKLSVAGTNGQFRTPRHIIRMMVEMTEPAKEDTICDPALGTAGFLVATSQYLHETHNDWFLDKNFREHYQQKMFSGIESDSQMMRIASMNLQLHGLENPNLISGSALAETNQITSNFSLILANPPFSGALDYDEVEKSLLQITKTKDTEILFLSLILRMLKLGGRCAVIVPDGVLFKNNNAYKGIRRELVENQQLQAVISMPSGVFKPYAGVSTAVLIFTKTNSGGTDKVWFYNMQQDGYSLDDKRNPQLSEEAMEQCFTEPENILEEAHGKCDIPFVLTDWQKVKNLLNEKEVPKEYSDRTSKSFLVTKDELAKNNYEFTFDTYKETVYKEVHYDAPLKIIADLDELDAKRTEALKMLKELLA